MSTAPLEIDFCVLLTDLGSSEQTCTLLEQTQPTCSSNPMYINCIIHCCTSGLLRSQTFLLVLLSLARNSWALEEGTAMEDFEGAAPAPATGWKHGGEREWKGMFQKLFTDVSLCISSVMILLSQMLPSLFFKILCRLRSLDTSVKESEQSQWAAAWSAILHDRSDSS